MPPTIPLNPEKLIGTKLGFLFPELLHNSKNNLHHSHINQTRGPDAVALLGLHIHRKDAAFFIGDDRLAMLKKEFLPILVFFGRTYICVQWKKPQLFMDALGRSGAGPVEEHLVIDYAARLEVNSGTYQIALLYPRQF